VTAPISRPSPTSSAATPPLSDGETRTTPALVVDDGAPLGRGLALVLEALGALPYAEAKRRLVACFDASYTGELLRRSGGNMSEAARRAGLDRSNFRRLLKRRREGE
jgi:DNA-binding NtrC family response regulator